MLQTQFWWQRVCSPRLPSGRTHQYQSRIPASRFILTSLEKLIDPGGGGGRAAGPRLKKFHTRPEIAGRPIDCQYLGHIGWEKCAAACPLSKENWQRQETHLTMLCQLWKGQAVLQRWSVRVTKPYPGLLRCVQLLSHIIQSQANMQSVTQGHCTECRCHFYQIGQCHYCHQNVNFARTPRTAIWQSCRRNSWVVVFAGFAL